jgi:hypothetical protein
MTKTHHSVPATRVSPYVQTSRIPHCWFAISHSMHACIHIVTVCVHMYIYIHICVYITYPLVVQHSFGKWPIYKWVTWGFPSKLLDSGRVFQSKIPSFSAFKVFGVDPVGQVRRPSVQVRHWLLFCLVLSKRIWSIKTWKFKAKNIQNEG